MSRARVTIHWVCNLIMGPYNGTSSVNSVARSPPFVYVLTGPK